MKKYLLLLLLLIPLKSQARTVALQWDYTQGTDSAIKFRMYRQAACTGNFIAVADIPYPTLTYLDNTVVDGSIYCYKVSAIDNIGGESTFSNVVQFQVPTTLTSPGNLRGTVN